MTRPPRRRVPLPAPAPEPATRALDVFLHYLKAEGATTVFGIPGGLLHAFFDAVDADPEMTLIVARHEEGAAFMADGFARVGRGLAVCASTGGPGSTNLLTGVACAFADGVPMLVLTGQVARSDQGRGAMQETNREDMDIVAMFRPVTKYSAMVPSGAMLGHHVRRALRRALAGRRGPVHLNVPNDLWGEPVTEDWFAPSTYRPASATFDRAAVKRAADELLDATHPALLVGSGVHAANARDHLLSLAEILPAHVATTPRAKGLFPEDHPLSLGILGLAGHREARDTLLGDQVDVLMTVGASLNETTTQRWNQALLPRRTLIQLDVESDRVGRNYPVDVPLIGDAQAILVELLYHLHRAMRDGVAPRSAWGEAPAHASGHGRYHDGALRTSDAVPITPQRWRCELEAVLPDDAVIFSDTGGHTLFNFHHLTVRRGQHFVVNLGFASMGHGTCAPIGAALAAPGRPVVAIVGDACFAMNGLELLTAVNYDVPVVWIVENNQMHGIVYHGSKLVGTRRPMECVRNRKPFDIAAIGAGMGLRTWIVERPGQMGPAARQALELRGPALIEVRVDPDISPPLHDRAASLVGKRSSDEGSP